MIEVRKRTRPSGSARSPTSAARNPTVLSFVRATHERTTATVLCVNNLSRFPQPVELDLRALRGRRARSS